MLANILKTTAAVTLSVLYIVSTILAAPIIIPLGAVLCYVMEGNLDGIKQLMKEMYVEYMHDAITLKVLEEL